MNEKDLKALVEQLVGQMVGQVDTDAIKEVANKVSETMVDKNAFIDDITEVDIKKQLLVESPKDREAYLDMKAKTPARIGTGRCGARYKTATALRVRADHAAAQDSVFSYVSEEFIKENNLFEVETLCTHKDEYLTRPDLGRRFSKETIDKIKSKFGTNQKVLLMAGDGLSSAAIEANLKDIVPSIKQGLKIYGIDSSEILFVKHCRVGAMDHLGEELKSEVICMLVGERPGLVTAESMSAYIAYKPFIGMAEAKRTVISNIHKGGTTAVEAGAHIADLIKTMLEKKASGIDLK
ncbi:ethanolamine ammonia-lyase subunit EutC [Clostridium sp. CCUG 7971]|uniref:ethanolamine ammonia-lyase subunit EutC n=1 Tax=Clostridium sp. CCUG 7971 TaxID=2811414 RepID=UPI001ABA88B1|nr:ethanolamine ammonia-lyase subunit EutC [Clostridium sp. CCUG 7971]MBO3443122.1 ethanolamine ammonia-lyase subunit EutC [Clostridium sp. CCUG 7971]